MVHRFTPKFNKDNTLINISTADKDLLNTFRESLKLSQSDFITLLLWIYCNTPDEQVQTYVHDLEMMNDDR
jgi:hypothetical protein